MALPSNPGKRIDCSRRPEASRDLIVAALETGCRLGELLTLQWDQVREDLFLPAGKTKAEKPRRVPISSVLRTVLQARRRDPAGEALPPSAFVFGDAVGRPRRSIKTAWRATCRRAAIFGAHDHAQAAVGPLSRRRSTHAHRTTWTKR
jgi:integrase